MEKESQKKTLQWWEKVPAIIGRYFIELAQWVGGASILAYQAVVRSFRPPFDWREVFLQFELLGVRSLRIALLTSAAAGAVLSLQFAHGLNKFGAKDYVGPVVSISLFRELIPVLIALVVGGRIGSGMTAELGSMKVGEQIDAIRALGADPIKKLVVPRLIASVWILPLLTILGDMIGIISAALLAYIQYDIPTLFFYQSVLDILDLSDFFSGLIKSVVFGFLTAIIGCYQGFSTTGGTQGVGLATTSTVELISISVLLSDFFLTKLLMLIIL